MQVSSLDWIFPRLVASFERWRVLERDADNVEALGAARANLEDNRAIARMIAHRDDRKREPQVVRKFDVDDRTLARMTRGLGKK